MKRLILIADDDERNLFALSAVLKAYGFSIITAKDGNECIDALKSNFNIGLVLLDMMMPVVDGYQTLKLIRSDTELKHTRVIALTAQAMTGDRERCIEAGADEYCTKPVDIDRLLALIEKTIPAANNGEN